MEKFRDPRESWLNAWAAEHVQERPGEPFPREAEELWDRLDSWVLNLSHWRVKRARGSLDPVELAARIRDKIFRYSHTFEGKGELTHWLNLIGRNEFRTMLKSNKRTTQINDQLPELAEQALRAQHAGSMRLLGGEKKLFLAELIAQIPNKRHAKIFLLARIEGLSDTEIGSQFDIRPKTVHSIIQRTIKRLRSVGHQRIGGPTEKVGPKRERAQRAAS